ncbi:MAG TPA: sulfotransferase [Blastocatellia bacterium]|nr:sulfotransferase [Blastocatellia bacterium]
MDHLRPSFFIIGVNKCGTSSLYRYLIAHPNVLPCALKEPNFFGLHSPEYVASHIDEYYALFPTSEHRGDLSFRWEASDQAGKRSITTVQVKRDPAKHYITGEASANTFHDVAPALLYRHLPQVKLIVLVRNPVDRAYSHHRMYRRFHAEGSYPGMDVRDFETDIRAELDAHTRGEITHYIGPGVYVDKLQRWVSQYGRERIRVIVTEELADPGNARRIMQGLEDYLEVPHHDYGDLLSRRFNHAPPYEMAPRLRALLADFYRPYNRTLQEYLGREIHWE